MGGYEGADHRNSHGAAVEPNRGNGHWALAEQDYASAAALRIRTVRESIGWRASTDAAGRTDLRRVVRMAEAARRAGVQVVWTLHHYGVPDGVDLFAPDFPSRFAGFCDEVARAIHRVDDEPPIFQPVNEISFLSWAGGHTRLIHPHRESSDSRAYDLKCNLVRAAILGCDALWATHPDARMVHTDPVVHVVASDPARADWVEEARVLHEAQFQAWDMLCGRLEAQLGGAPRYLDLPGLNYYHSNQWAHPSNERLHWHLRDERRRDGAALIDDVWQRYGRPLILAETGHVGDGRALWIDEIGATALRCRREGIPLEGVCLYPLIDRPDWEDESVWHASGLWDVDRRTPVAPGCEPAPARTLHRPSAARLLHWQGVLAAATQAHGALALSPHSTTPPDRPMTTLIVFSHLRWDFVYQRPQQLLSRLAADMPVIFVEEPFTNAARATLERLVPCEGVEVLRPHLPGAAPGFHDEHLPQLQAMLADHLREQGIDDYWLWFYTPMAAPLADGLRPRGIVYDCMDELSAFRHAPPQLLAREQHLFDIADLVFTGGESLYQAKRTRHAHVHCFPSSVDAAHYAQGAPDGRDHPAQADIPHPRLGWCGVIDERVDLDLIAALADAHDEWQVVMVGPVVKIDPATLPQRPNIHWLGQRSYQELPGLMAGWDVCLLPFALNESTRFISPTKTLEYLAAGRPVVSTPIRDVVGPYTGVVAIAEDAPSFVAACEAALAADDAELARRAQSRSTVLAATSWDRTAAEMKALIEGSAGARASAPREDDASIGSIPTVAA
ncbi:MAG: glycosyltransferase family 1 protein [Comamonadaceae bacterium]|nr:MAG: glycosyltransferase family 1 protein [Comamonadaceae bacterium]